MKERVISGEKILKDLEYKQMYLFYGIPFPSIPYKLIATFDDNSDEAFIPAYDLVEKEKTEGRPGAFVLNVLNFDKNDWVYEVWGWAD